MSSLRSIVAASIVTGAAIVAVLTVAGCGGGGTSGSSGTTKQSQAPTAPARTTGKTPASPAKQAGSGAAEACVPVPQALTRRILAHVVLAKAHLVQIRAAGASQTPGYFYVSGSISGSGAHGLLATWATKDLTGKRPIYAVDANAAMISAYGAAANLSESLNIVAPGAYRSRVCVAGEHASHGSPAPMGTGGPPATQ